MSDTTIEIDDLSGAEIARLLTDHVDQLRAITPPESKHALDLEGLRQPEVTFWCARRDGRILGCGALKDLGDGHGELKSMRTTPTATRQGIASSILAVIEAEARRRGFRRLSLETGAAAFFEPARNLYAKNGFTPCPPFGDYRLDPNSVYLTKPLDVPGSFVSPPPLPPA